MASGSSGFKPRESNRMDRFLLAKKIIIHAGLFNL